MIDQIIETFIRAGYVIYFIFFVSIYAWLLIIKKYFFIRNENSNSDMLMSNVISFMKKKKSTGSEELFPDGKNLITESVEYIARADKKEQIETLIEEKRLFYFSILDSGTGTVTTLAAIAPLLGLLGTVTGMMKTFGVIKLFGSANPALMADGISEALLTTQAGLIVAFPIVLANTFLKNRIKDLKDNFEKICMKIRGNHV